MDATHVRDILTDLPPTFQRSDATYGYWLDGWTAGLFRYTLSSDGTLSQIDFDDAQYGWLDFWGLLLGVPRNTQEADPKYQPRIKYTLSTGAGSPEAIRLWMLNVWGLVVTVKENFPAFGYEIVLPGTLTEAQALVVLQSLIYVRPAGVPFFASFSNTGLYLQTINFLDAPKVTGAYLTGGTNLVLSELPTTTNNAAPLLPDLYLTDPLLNPGLATT